MPKIKKGILGIASKKRQSIDFKQIFSKILGKALILNKVFFETVYDVIKRINAYIVRLRI